MTRPLNRSVSIIGVGCTPIGNVTQDEEILGCTEGDLLAAAVAEAAEDANIDISDIEAGYVGHCGPAGLGHFLGSSGHLADCMGLRNRPFISHDEGCTTSNIGLQQAIMDVASGAHDIVVSTGVGIITSSSPAWMPHLRRFTGPRTWDEMLNVVTSGVQDDNYHLEGNGSFSPLDDWVSMYALKYGVSFEDMMATMNKVVAIQKHQAAMNEKCLVTKEDIEVTAKRLGFDNVDDYLASPVYNPRMGIFTSVLHNAVWSDGASAQIVVPSEMADQFVKHPIDVLGFASTASWSQHFGSIPIKADVEACQQAYKMAGITDPYKEIDYMATHDCSAQNWFIFAEDAGYYRPGEAWKGILEGRSTYEGDRPINTSGGRLGCGHPIGSANGIEIYEAVNQMLGRNGNRQMATPPKTALIHSIGGSWHFSATVLRAR